MFDHPYLSITHRGSNTILEQLPLATLEGDGQFKRLLLETAQAQGPALKIELLYSSFLTATAAVKQGSLAAVLPPLAQSELPPRDYDRLGIPLLKKLRRPIVLAYNARILLTRPKLLPGVNGL